MKRGLIMVLLFYSVLSSQQKSELKNVQVLPFTVKKEIVQYMKKVIAPGLGVKCKFCHNPMDFSSDKNEHKVVAREMMKMVTNINRDTMAKLKFHEVSCFVCHRGEKLPVHPENQ